jgi:hypothetical protein
MHSLTEICSPGITPTPKRSDRTVSAGKADSTESETDYHLGARRGCGGRAMSGLSPDDRPPAVHPSRHGRTPVESHRSIRGLGVCLSDLRDRPRTGLRPIPTTLEGGRSSTGAYHFVIRARSRRGRSLSLPRLAMFPCLKSRYGMPAYRRRLLKAFAREFVVFLDTLVLLGGSYSHPLRSHLYRSEHLNQS